MILKSKETSRLFYFSFLIISLFFPGCSSSSEEEDKNTETEFKGGGSISLPSNMLDGVKPEASWIWDSGEDNPRNYFLHVRKSFSLEASAQEANAYISASAFAELYINGKFIDRVPTNPDPEYQIYEEIDLVPYLRKGTNTIAALVYNPGEGLHHRMDARGGFFFQADISDRSGALTKILSDKSWRVTRALAWDTGTIYRQVRPYHWNEGALRCTPGP